MDKKIKHSAGLAIVYDNKILLVHPTNQRWWRSYGIPKGGVDDGETHLQAAIRETYEETGIYAPKRLIDKTPHTVQYRYDGRKFNPDAGVVHKIVTYFVAHTNDIKRDLNLDDLVVPKKQLQIEEVDWAGFLTIDEALKRTMKNHLPIVKSLLK